MGTCVVRLDSNVSGGSARICSPLNAGNNGVGVGSLLGSLVGLSDDDDLLSGLSTSEDDGDLSGLVDCIALVTAHMSWAGRVSVGRKSPRMCTPSRLSPRMKFPAR